eukprot:COSAG03_NODE_163_length_11308_cov_5.701044_5_plen_73_part_00
MTSTDQESEASVSPMNLPLRLPLSPPIQTGATRSAGGTRRSGRPDARSRLLTETQFSRLRLRQEGDVVSGAS